MRNNASRTLLTSSLLVLLTLSFTIVVAAVQAPRTPTDTVREFYKGLREKRFKEAFGLSIYKSAIEGLSQQEYNDLLPDFERVAHAVTEKIPEKLELGGEQISGDTATVFVKMLDSDGKEKVEPTTLIKVDGIWIVGDQENLQLVKKAGNRFFFDARIDAHHNDVQDMLTRIGLAQVVYGQQNGGRFADLPKLIGAGLVPKDIEGTETTGYRFNVKVSPDGKSWSATAEPAQYGRTGKLSFYLDPTGVRSGDVGGKPLTVGPVPK